MEEKLWGRKRRSDGGEIRKDKSRMEIHGGKIMKEKAWRRNHGGEIMEEKSWAEIMEDKMCRRSREARVYARWLGCAMTLTKSTACAQKLTGGTDAQTPQSLHPASRTTRQNPYSKADCGTLAS